MTAYSKAIAAAIGAAATWAATYFPHAPWLGIVVAAAAVAGVYVAPKNTPADASDKGETFMAVLWAIALIVVIVVGAVWLFHRIG